MVLNYQVTNQCRYLEDIEEYLMFIAEIVLKPSRFLLNKLNSFNSSFDKKHSNRDAFINKYKELQVEFNESKINLYHEMDSLANSLKKNELFYDEYFDFCEIEDIIKYTLDRDFSLIEDADFDFIMEMITDFSEIVNYKIDLVEKDSFSEEKFKNEYNSYLTAFNKSKTYYYENICDDVLDDDLFSKYTKIFME